MQLQLVRNRPLSKSLLLEALDRPIAGLRM